MKKTTQIHIGGRHFFIDEDAYRKLNHYLESLEAHFASDGDTGKEIVDDIEQRIAELLESRISNGKQAITVEDINEVIGTLGKVEDFVYAGANEENPQEFENANRRDNRRFYRDPDNYYIGGVCSGLGEYFDIDPLWIRLAFVLFAIFKGAGVLIYLILWIVVPKARTTAEKLQMRGKPVNLSTIKDSVNEEYERVKSGDGTVSSSSERTRNALDNLMRSIGLVFVAIFKFMVAAIGVFLLVLGSIFLAGFVMFILGFTNVFGHFEIWNGVNIPQFADFFASNSHYYAAVIALVVLIIIPIVALIYGGVKILFNIRTKHPVLRAFLLTAWILAFILFITLMILNVPNSPIEASGSESTKIETASYPHIVISVNDNTENKSLTKWRVMGYKFTYSKWDDELIDNARLNIQKSADDNMYLTVSKNVKNVDPYNSAHYMNRVDYHWEQKDSAVVLDKYFNTDDDEFWMFAKVKLDLQVPEGQKIMINQEVCDMLDPKQQKLYCNENPIVQKAAAMSAGGLLVAAE
jgi:phage shock protein PspC (stress-responsive transcriptional regulator)